MKTMLYNDVSEGTRIVFNDRPHGESEVRITVPSAPFGQHTMTLDLDEVDRLLSLYEHAATPELDLMDHFGSVYHVQRSGALQAAKAFVASARSLGDIVYGSA